MNSYIKKKKIGEGSYASVYLASVTEKREEIFVDSGVIENEKNVAIKHIKKNKYSVGHEISAIREIKSLKKISSKFVIKLLDVFVYDTDLHMVLEYVETDLEAIIRNKDIIFMPSDIKSWMFMLLNGVYKIHEMYIIHRDLKPNNILITKDGIIKIADFGLARPISNNMTPQAVTRWYRAPELLLGSKNYGFGVDMWSIGCIFAELLLRVPLFAAETDIEQLHLIFKVFGTPDEEKWSTMSELPGFFKLKKSEGVPLESIFSAASTDVLYLLRRLFTYNPLERISCYECLKSEYFSNNPRPTHPKDLPFFVEHTNK